MTSTEPGASPGTTSPSGPQGGQAGAGDIASQLLAFAECMRSNGVPTFPDPSAGGGFQVPAGTDTSSPAYEAAEVKCQKLLPAGPGSGPPPSSQALANMVKVAQCMRRHGISEFPDPRTSVPSRILPTAHSGIQEISDIDGVILVFPTTIDMQSPAFTQAAAACRFPLHNH